MKFIKYIVAILLTVILLFQFVVNFSGVSSSFECAGEISSGENTEPKTIYIVLDEYRWWVGLWSDSDGNLQLEIPNETVEIYLHLVEVGNQIQIYYDSPNEMKGNFSKLSKTLALKGYFGFFDGKCKAI